MTMFEKLARAICCPGGCTGGPSGHCIAYQCEAPARAVLDALMEPTEEMLEVGFSIEEERYSCHSPQEDLCAGDVWQAMLNRAKGD